MAVATNSVNTANAANRRKPGVSALRAAALAAAVAISGVVAGCASSQEKTPTTTTQFKGPVVQGDQPMVISGTPKRDAIAFMNSGNQLTATDFGVIDKVSPKPIWEQYNLGRNKIQKAAAEAENGAATQPVASAADTLDAPATQPGTLDVVASTRPAGFAPTAALPLPLVRPVNTAELPVTIAEMPDGRLRIIWVLRSYGGTTVTTTRDGGVARRGVTVTPADLAPLVNVITQQLGANGAILPLPRENTLVITCVKEQRDTILNLLAGLDIPPRQVEITAKIFEVSHDFDYQQGARLLFNKLTDSGSATGISTFNAAKFAASPQPPAGNGSVISLMKAFQDAGINIEASFQLLAETGLIRVVSSPRMTVAAGQTGYMLAGQELPIQTTTIAANATTTATTYKPVGVQLYITPQAVGADRIKLHAISIVSSVAGFTTLPTLSGGSAPVVNPIIESREAETAVTIDNGHTLVISGLRMIRTTTREEKVPGLGDIPAIGNMFKNHRSQQQMTDLYFFVTPTLL